MNFTMQTKIKTKDLLKVINPFDDGINYQGQQIKIVLDELTKYVEDPTSFKLFEKSDDLLIDFYRNAALYILNSDNSPKYISINLDRKNPIDNGLFEYINNIYRNTSFTYLELENNTNNDILIKSKKLTDVTEELKLENVQLTNAVDEYMCGLTSIFAESNQITKKDKFFWGTDSTDLYSQLDFVLEKIDELHFWRTDAVEQFNKLISMTNKDLVESKEFKLALLDKKRSSVLQKFLIKDNGSITFSLDFTEKVIQDLLLSRIKNNDFSLFIDLAEHYFETKKHACSDWDADTYAAKLSQLVKIDWNSLFNLTEVIEFLINRVEPPPSTYSSSDNDFTVLNCYPYLNETNKYDHNIIEKYINRIKRTREYGYYNIEQEKLLELPLTLFNEEFFLSKVCGGIDFGVIRKKLKENNITPTLLSNPETLKKLAPNLSPHNIDSWINNFINNKEITKDFLATFLTINGNFFKAIHENPSYKDLRTNLDLITIAYKHGFDLTNLNRSLMSDILITESNNPTHELLKLQYVIESNLLSDAKYLYTKPQEFAIFKEKYLKPEYILLTSTNKSYLSSEEQKVLSKLKKAEDVLAVIDKIEKDELGYTFQSKKFYLCLPEPMKKNPEIAERLLRENQLTYEELHPALRFNIRLAKRAMEINVNNIMYIPHEFFNDINFSLAYTKIMDEHKINLNSSYTPPFIKRFFENQNVNENFHNYLTTYVSFNSLKETMTNDNEIKPKKIKI